MGQKCDGHRPVCLNCSGAETRCSFLDKDEPYIVPVFSSGQSPTAVSGNTSAPKNWSGRAANNQELVAPYIVNLTHLALFKNLSSKSFLSLQEPGYFDIIPIAIYADKALKTSYLMHQVLATSALHLSIISPESRIYYREYATGLQSNALMLFNQNNPVLEVTKTNCVDVVLFSSLVGVHFLCDTLHFRRGSLQEFIDAFTHCLTVYRGVRTIVSQGYDLLQETELWDSLRPAKVAMPPTGEHGSECNELRFLISALTEGPAARDAYREAVYHLQQLFDTQHRAFGDKAKMPVGLAWPTVVSSTYVDLLRQRQPEALVILAHYAVLLHRGRDLWLIGDGGQFLIESICASLGSDWQEWLKVPTEALLDRT